MASNETVLKIRAEIDNLQGLNQLKTALRKSSAEAKGADNDFKGLVQKVRELQSASVKSINNLNAQRDAFEALRRSADVTSKEFKEARDEIEKIDRALKEASGTVVKYSKNSIKALRAQKNELLAVRDSADLMSKEFKEAGVELAKLDKKLAKAEGRGRGGRLRAGAQIAGTVAGAGVFGGPEGAIGSLTGAAFGGLPGAVVGGAIGAQVSQLRKLATSTAEYKAEVSKLRIALQNVVGLDYQFSLEAIEKASTDFNFSIKDTTRTFTRLAAAGTASGSTVKELEVLYRGLAAATKATGGSTEDLNGVLLAATQVLSKGKVSAEELRGQIGERLPGAFSLFAQATGRTTQQLDEDLKAGAVSAEEFVTDFANFINNKYKNAAAEIANSPAEAGARLELTLKNLQLAIGPILADIGAGFQQFAIDAINNLNPLIAKLNELLRVDRKGKNERLYELEGGGVGGVGRIDLIRSEINRVLGVQPGKPIETERIPGAGQYVGTSKDDAFEFLSKALVRAESQAAQLRLELFPVARKQVDLPTSRPARADGDGKGDKSSEAAERRIGIAILGIEKLMSKLKSMNVDLTLSTKKVGATVEEEIKIKYEQSLQKAIDVTEGLNNQLIKYEDTIGRTVPEVREELNKLRMAYVDLADAERAAALQELADKRFGEKLKGYGFTGEALDAGGKIFAAGALDQQAFPTGVDSVLNPNKLKESIEEMKKGLEELVNPVNQIVSAANAIGNSFAQSFKSVINGSATAQQALASFFQNIGSYFLDMAAKILAEMIKISILNAVTGLLPVLGSSVGSGFNLGGFGDLSPDAASGTSGFLFGANLSGRANGGPVSANTPYIVGERGPEMFVPQQSGMVLDNNETRDQLTAQRAAAASNETRDQLVRQEKNMQTNYMRQIEKTTESMIASPKPLDIRFESTSINGVEYVTAEQHRKGMAQAAERGRAMTLTTLQNSPRTRSRVGI